jgi:alkaline phosphatase D
MTLPRSNPMKSFRSTATQPLPHPSGLPGRRSFTARLLLPLACSWFGAIAAAANEAPLTRIAFGSCMKQDRPAPVFQAVAAAKPELFIWMGDNIYADTEDPEVFRKKYAQLAAHPDYAALRGKVPVIGTWDDHDFGANDAGKEFPAKQLAQEQFLDFFEVPADSPRRQREGVYSSEDYGPDGRKVRIILLDARYHRDPPGPDGDILGETQWQWLEEQLVGSPAQVHLLVSGIQVLPADHRFEKWADHPQAKARLLALLAREDVPPVILLSGDRHLAEISVDQTSAGYPLYEITSSSLNAPSGGNRNEVNRLRIGQNYGAVNFGTLTIDWFRENPVVTLAVRDLHGAPQRAATWELAR